MALIKLNNRSSEDNAIHGRRNIIINGAMKVAQRGTSVTGLEVGQGRTCDRIGTYVNSGTWTVTQETDSPDGFSNSFKILATAVESAAVGDQVQVFYTIEGQDLQGVAKGTSSAKTMTLSFWCKSNKTGTHAVTLRDQDNNRSCTKYFTINSVDTWEYKTILIPADTTGTFDNDNAGSLQLEIWMRGGTNYTSGTPTGAWETFDNSIRLGVGHTATVGTAVNDYFQITGLQLEVGSVATPFEHRSYGEELALCQRYYYKISDNMPSDAATDEVYFPFSCVARNTNAISCFISFPVSMRIAPQSVEWSGTVGDYKWLKAGTFGVANTGSFSHGGGTSNQTARIDTTLSSAIFSSTGEAALLRGATKDAYFAWSAEL